MPVFRIPALIYVEAPDGTDPEDVATTMDLGLTSALSSFPGGEVIGTSVEGITVATDEELAERGLVE